MTDRLFDLEPSRGGRLPRIGVSSSFFPADPTRAVFKGKTLLYVDEAMSHWVGSGGALTYLVPTAGGTGPAVQDWVADLDGLVLTGGSDVCPRTYGEVPLKPEWEGDEVRDEYEIDLLHRFIQAGKPVLGICRGAQIINVAFGGSLYQDISTQKETEVEHRDWDLYEDNVHRVTIESRSGLSKLYPGVTRALINSVHHQSVKDLGAELRIEARSSVDGVVEAIRLVTGDDVDDGGPYVFGVQWHPEWVGGRADLLASQPILDDFLDHARALVAS